MLVQQFLEQQRMMLADHRNHDEQICRTIKAELREEFDSLLVAKLEQVSAKSVRTLPMHRMLRIMRGGAALCGWLLYAAVFLH